MFQTNSDIHAVSTRNKHDFQRLLAKCTIYQKEVHYAGIKLDNKLILEVICTHEQHIK